MVKVCMCLCAWALSVYFSESTCVVSDRERKGKKLQQHAVNTSVETGLSFGFCPSGMPECVALSRDVGFAAAALRSWIDE